MVGALASLLVATLGLPVAGIPGAATRLLHHPRDTPHPFLLTGRGQQLTAIQNIVHQRLADNTTTMVACGRLAALGLPVDSSVNLERAFVSSSCSGGYNPVPATRYGLGQVRTRWIKESDLSSGRRDLLPYRCYTLF